MDQFEQLPSNSNEVRYSSAYALSPSLSLPVTQPQAQTPPQLSGLPPLRHIESRKSLREKSERAKCKYCSVTYAADPNLNGTSSLRKYIESLCKKYPRRVGNDKRQKTLPYDQALGGISTIWHTKDDWLTSCVEMVVMDEMPFSVVEGKGFWRFCELLNPHFQMPSRRTLGNSIGKLLETCLPHCDLKKILAITTDNASSSMKTIDYLKSKMGHWKNGCLVLEGKYTHVRFCAHIINLIVRDGLKKLEKSILSIRNAVRWNLTYMMLDAALREDEGVVAFRPKKRVGPPTKEDWSNALIFVKFLKGEIGDLLFGDQLPSQTHTSTVLKDMACSMKMKFEKYWGDLDKVNQLSMVVLDPRYKFGNLEFVLKRRFENLQDATKKKNEVKKLLMKLYEEYVISPPPTTQGTSANGDTSYTISTTRRKAPLGNGEKLNKRISSK
ncbi:unnamed protein product [Prunus armeniaca]